MPSAPFLNGLFKYIVLNPYISLIIFTVICSLFLLGMLFLASVLGPRYRTTTKQEAFECGAIPIGDISQQRFPVRFYLIAVLFLLFDVEVVLLYPWAVGAVQYGTKGVICVFGFLAVVAIALRYVHKRGVFNWND